jgi:uncharacterized protein (TIGR03435 family)
VKSKTDAFHRFFTAMGLIALIVFGLLAASDVGFAQSTSARPVFDVATVKPAAPLDMAKLAADVQAGRMPKIGPEIGAVRASFTYMSLTQLIATAYNARLYQISGPAWLSDTRFDIEGTIPEGATKDDVPAMLRALLEERFKLVAHKAQEEHKVLALVVGKSGPKMKQSPAAPAPIDPNAPLQPGERQIDGPDGPIRMKVDSNGTVTLNMGAKGTMKQKFDRQNRSLNIESSAVTMDGFAEMLSNQLMQMGGANSRQVVDMTGLKGFYQVDLEISLADLMDMARSAGVTLPAAPPSASAGANAVPVASDPGGGTSVFESVGEMGLKLQDRQATVERLVIDHVEKTPTEN